MRDVPARETEDKRALIAAAVARAAARYARHGIIDAGEAIQEGWLICLENGRRFRPDHPSAAGFYVTILGRALPKAIARMSSPVSLSDHRAASRGGPPGRGEMPDLTSTATPYDVVVELEELAQAGARRALRRTEAQRARRARHAASRAVTPAT